MLRLLAFAAALGVSAEDIAAKLKTTQAELDQLLSSPVSLRSRFKRFARENNRDYIKAGQEDKFEARLQTFATNLKLASRRNKNGKGTVVHGITNLMDYTSTEFQGLLGYGKGKGNAEYLANKMKTVRPQDVLKLKKKFLQGGKKDWRDEGAVTPVKDQGQCGSCWAFSTVETMESAALVQGLFDKSNPFIGAPQELVSCDPSDNGCNGGLPEIAFKYLKRTPLEAESDYPYTSGGTEVDGSCKLDKSEGVMEVVKATQTSIWGIGEDSDMTDWMMTRGPLSIAVHANTAWQTYMGGVVGYDECPDDEQPNHAVQAVALDQDNGYWVVRNSWAAGWGEDGYIRLTYKENTCNIAFETFGVEVKRVDQTPIINI